MLESPSSSFTPIEHHELNFDDILKNFNNQKIEIKKIKQAENKDRQIEEKELIMYEEYFNGKRDFDDFSIKLDNINQDINQYEVKENTQESSEKEKLLIYSRLADLSYIHLKTNSTKLGSESFEFETISLDPASFEHIGTIFDHPNLATFTEDEIFIYNYINKNIDAELKYNLALNSEIKEIVKMAGLAENILAINDEKYRNTLTDIQPESAYENHQIRKKFLLMMGLDELIKEKEIELKQKFETLKQDFEILDSFPNKIKGDKDSSGFGAIFLEKNGKKYIAIRGTEGLNDWKDLYADGKMLFGKIPEEQTKYMMDFINRCIIPGEKFSIVGHSLGGALSQIGTAMYVDQIKETYTFNSPGAKNLKVGKEDLAKFAKFRDFVHNRDSKKVGDLITNVEGTKGMSLISDLGEDIGSYTIELKGLSSHSITDTIHYIDKLPNNSPELIKKKVKRIQIKDIKFKR